ncbi:MAG: NUDIX domain-containing protein [bacterium]
MIDYENLGYREGIIAMVMDTDDNFLIVNLVDYKEREWNFPAGGREENETYEETLFRELNEELSIKKEEIEILGKSSFRLKYDFPYEVIKRNIERGRNFRGQIKEQYLVRYVGKKETIIPQESEIRSYKWIKREELKNHLHFNNQLSNTLKVLEELNF